MNLASLPRFTISKVLRLRPDQDGYVDFEVSGTVSDVRALEVGSRYWLYVSGGDYSPIVDVLSLDQKESTATLDGLAFPGSPKILIGDSYPIITAYWNANIYAAILDDRRIWTKTPVTPTGSFETMVPGYVARSTPSRPGLTRYYPTAEAPVDKTARVVDGGWDHEHCGICNEHIGADDPAGFVDPDGLWLCDKCFGAFAEPHDLRFIRKYP